MSWTINNITLTRRCLIADDTIVVVEFDRCFIIREFIYRYHVFRYVGHIMNFFDFNEVLISKLKMGSYMSKGIFNPIIPKSQWKEVFLRAYNL